MSNPNLSAYVADHLRACQLKQLSILEEVDRICKKHDIGYWLDGGSLLGAVRHGGFIPWDDDIDIGMTKSDLERFEKIAPAGNIPLFSFPSLSPKSCLNHSIK